MIGDTRQHEGVEAGRPFQQLQEAGMRTAKLEEIVRQKDPSLKATVELLADGQTAAAIEALKRQGRVKQITDPQERIQTIARNYVASPDPTSIVSPGRPPFLGCSFHDGRGMARSGGESTVSCNEQLRVSRQARCRPHHRQRNCDGVARCAGAPDGDIE